MQVARLSPFHPLSTILAPQVTESWGTWVLPKRTPFTVARGSCWQGAAGHRCSPLDQAANAERLAAVGAGVHVEGEVAAVGDLPAAVSHVLADPSYRHAAQVVAADIAALPVVSASVPIVEAVGGRWLTGTGLRRPRIRRPRRWHVPSRAPSWRPSSSQQRPTRTCSQRTRDHYASNAAPPPGLKRLIYPQAVTLCAAYRAMPLDAGDDRLAVDDAARAARLLPSHLPSGACRPGTGCRWCSRCHVCIGCDRNHPSRSACCGVCPSSWR